MDAQHATQGRPGIFGLMAEFPDPTSLVVATQEDARGRLPERSMPTRRSRSTSWSRPSTPTITACSATCCSAGSSACIAGFGLCYWVSTIAYPLNIGGRPFNSWPSFIPVTFELTILFASFAAVLSWIC